jgi:DHA2 family multidrug resistance protein-like MFS transporter
MTLASDAIIGAASADRAGDAGAIQETAFSLGGGLGIGVLGAVMSLAYQADFVRIPTVAPSQLDIAQKSIGAAMKTADQLDGPAGTALRENARHAFHSGFTVAAAVAASALAALAILTATLLRPAHRHDRVSNRAQ